MLKRVINMRNSIKNLLCILCFTVFCLSLTACSKRTYQIDAEDVEKVTIYVGNTPLHSLNSRTDGVELIEQDRDELIRLYNEAGYAGTDRNDNPSPEYICVITLQNGSIIKFDKRHDNDFWLEYSEDGTSLKDSYYIQSIELKLFLTKLADTLL